MPLINNKVGNDATVGSEKDAVDGKALVDSLIKVNSSFDQSFSFTLHLLPHNFLISCLNWEWG